MTLYEGNIITKRERNGRQVTWIAEEALMKMLKGLEDGFLRTKARWAYKKTVPKKRRNQKVLPDTGAAWRWAKIKGGFYYDYDRIPDDVKANYRSRLPEKEAILEMYKESLSKRRQTEIEIKVKRALVDLYKEYLHCYRAYKEACRLNLAKACAVLETAVNHVMECGLPVNRNEFFIEFAEVVQRYGIHYLPKNHRRLKEKVLAVIEGTPVANLVDLPRQGNSNSLKYDDPQLISWIFSLRSSPRNYTNAYIVRKVQQLCVLLEKAVPSESWFAGLLAEHETKYLTAQGRWGTKGRKSWSYRGYIPMEGALHAGDCWQADGTRVNFIGHKNEDGSEKFLYIISIRDVHSGDLVGVHLDTKEDRWGYINALRMAVEFTGYLPYELVIDRFPGHNTEEWKNIQGRIETAGVKVTTTSLATGKSAVERSFGTIQTVFMQDSDYYYGEGVQSRRDYAHRAPEYLYAVKKRANKEGWDFDASWKEMMNVIDRYRNTRLSDYSRKYKGINLSPRELHEQSEKPAVIQADPLLRIELFGLEKKVSIRNAGLIKTEIQRITYHFEVNDYEVLANNKEVILRYDMEDLSTVFLFDLDDNYLCEAKEQRAPQIYGPEADMKALSKAKMRIKQIEERRKADLEEKIAESGELELLMAGLNKKEDAASAETDWLMQRLGGWKDNGRPKLPEDSDDEEMIEIDVRSQY